MALPNQIIVTIKQINTPDINIKVIDPDLDRLVCYVGRLGQAGIVTPQLNDSLPGIVVGYRHVFTYGVLVRKLDR